MPTFSRTESTTSHDWQNKCRRNKHKNIRKYILVILVLGCFLSCIPYKTVDFQMMRPAKIKIGPGIHKVDIHCEFCFDPASIKFLDTIGRIEASVSLNFLHTLHDKLQKSPLLENAAFSLIPSDSLLLELKDFKKRYSVNGILIVLDSIFLRDTVIVEYTKSGASLYTFGIIHKFGCRTYNLKNMQLIDNYLLEDTVFWPPQFSELDLYMNIPPVNDALWDTGINGGETFARHLAPYWVDQSRIFYLRNKDFKEAFKYLQNNQLDSSLNVLNKVLQHSSSQRKRTRALYNAAVVYELKDDLENALIMADSSYHISRDDRVFKMYSERLRIRKLDKMALDWQLN